MTASNKIAVVCRITLARTRRNFSDVVEGSSRPTVRAGHILDTSKKGTCFTLLDTSTVQAAIAHLVREKIGCSLVVNKDNDVCGIFTARDIIAFLHKSTSPVSGAFSNYHTAKNNGSSSTFSLEAKVSEVMMPKEKLVFCTSTDSRRRCREVMFLSKVRNLPVIDNGEVKGIITVNMLTDSMFSVAEVGGKKGFISNVTGRKGLPEGTKWNHESADSSTHTQTKLDLLMSSFALPHPFKKSKVEIPENEEVDAQKGVSMSRRLFGAGDLCEDINVSEDALFTLKVDEVTSSARVAAEGTSSYMCVADGVGSWRQYGINPREYSHKLVENAKKIIEMDVENRKLMQDNPFGQDLHPIHPLDVLVDAWHLTGAENTVTGSCTICIATLDKILNQISYSNIGDGGLMVVRHIDSETAGYMRDRTLPRYLRTNDLKIAYLSQQQLRSFNLPYQLGSNGTQTEVNFSFESPADADTASIPVLPGDIIVLATDGLFDNLDLDEIVDEISSWEEDHLNSLSSIDPSSNGSKKDDEKKEKERETEKQTLEVLAKRLVMKARLLSLDKNRDSPFAILAKENDIMWGGGMPDDTTVVVGRVVRE